MLPEKVKKDILDKVNNRPVFFIGRGHSIEQLYNNIERLKKIDFSLVSANNISTLLSEFGKIDKKIDIVALFAVDHIGDTVSGNTLVLKYSESRGNTLMEVLLQLNEAGVEKVYLFGCDGYSRREWVYHDEQARPIDITAHKRDCAHFNSNFPKDLKTKIYNVSQESFYEPFEKISYEEFFNHFPDKAPSPEVKKLPVVNTKNNKR